MRVACYYVFLYESAFRALIVDFYRIVLLRGMKSIYFKPFNIILSLCNDNTKDYLGSRSRLNGCQCDTLVQNRSYIHICINGVQNI